MGKEVNLGLVGGWKVELWLRVKLGCGVGWSVVLNLGVDWEVNLGLVGGWKVEL